MAKLFANKYRVETARLQSWNYANEAIYYVTICTKNRKHYFGEIMGASPGIPVAETRCIASLQQPTEIGEIERSEWFKTPGLRPDMNLELGEFVVMPDHIHGIIMIGANEYNTVTGIAGNKFAPQSKNLASVIRGYKSAVTTYARKNKIPFDWQPRFYDHIVRSAADHHRISNYIINNPAKWLADKITL